MNLVSVQLYLKHVYVVSMVKKLKFLKCGEFGSSWGTMRFTMTLLHAVSQLLTAQQTVYPHTTNCITVLWTATIQSVAPTPHSVHCTFHCTLSVGKVKGCWTVHFVQCSVSSIRSSNSKQCCCVSELAKFEVLLKNTVWYSVTSQLCDTVLLVATASTYSLTQRESKFYDYVHCTGCLLLKENCCSTNRKFYVTCYCWN